jgi:glycosyltransferase involved in cell wall biosynthesis
MKTIVISSGDLTMGGLQKILVEYLKLIDKNKYRIVLLIANDYGKKNLFLEEIPKNVEIQFVRPYNLVSKIAELSKNRKILNRLLLKRYRYRSKRVFKSIFLEKLSKLGKIDLIIDFDGGLKSVLDNLKAEKIIIWIHSSIRKHKQDNKSKISRYGEELKKYDKIIAICKEMKEEIKELYPSLSHKIEYIYNPLDCNNIIEQGNENIEKMTSYEKELIERDYFLAVSRLDTVQKDFETLIEGYSILKNKGIKEKLYIIGEGNGRVKIEKMIEEKNLGQDVILLGEKKNPYVWMKNSKLFIHSSRYEGFGVVLLEALMLDKFVISSNCPTGPTEILTNPKAGELFDVGDANQLAEKVLKVLYDKDYQKELLKNIQLKKKEFELSEITEKFHKTIENLCNEE